MKIGKLVMCFAVTLMAMVTACGTKNGNDNGTDSASQQNEGMVEEFYCVKDSLVESDGFVIEMHYELTVKLDYTEENSGNITYGVITNSEHFKFEAQEIGTFERNGDTMDVVIDDIEIYEFKIGENDVLAEKPELIQEERRKVQENPMVVNGFIKVCDGGIYIHDDSHNLNMFLKKK